MKRREEEERAARKRREPRLLVGDGEIRGGFGGKMDVGDGREEDWKAVTRLESTVEMG